jgi:hypothetical protein
LSFFTKNHIKFLLIKRNENIHIHKLKIWLFLTNIFLKNQQSLLYFLKCISHYYITMATLVPSVPKTFPSRTERVRQWMLFSRQWSVIDADRQVHSKIIQQSEMFHYREIFYSLFILGRLEIG